MTISAGTRLGAYEILSPLGAGGMGEVYRARDARLSREVAIKVLPADVSGDASRLRRFEKEARAASALNHPNIVTIYEIGSAEHVSFIAMEKVEGRTLRELLFGGALPIKRLLAIAAQIADGLAKAHEGGIVHRDLKPENVMVTKDGLVKILDFGLAKRTETVSGSTEVSHLPTETGTSPGMVLGTVGYMSPEQAAGQRVDFRSDQFSFGSILYEMATGKRAFQKGTAVDTLSAILHEEPPPLGESTPEAPAPLRWIVERCLAKPPDERYGTTRDLARELQTVRDHLSEALRFAGPSETAARPGRALRRIRVPALLLLAVVGAGILVVRASSRVPHPSFRRLTFRHGWVGYARFTPDSRSIVYSASWDRDPFGLFLARPESPDSLLLRNEANILSISSLGEMAISLGNGLPATLAQMSLAGGAPRELLENVSQAEWAPDGKTLAVIHHVGGRNRIEYPIGKVLYDTPNRIDNMHLSRDGSRIAFREVSSRGFQDPSAVRLIDQSGRVTPLPWIDSTEFAWSPDGRELWFLKDEGRQGSVELRARTLAGKERRILALPGEFQIDDVATDGRMLLDRVVVGNEVQYTSFESGKPAERSLSWLQSRAVALTPDGKTALLNGQFRGVRTVFLRPTDGSPAIALGEGTALALSNDGSWALAYRGTSPARLVLLPTKAGDARILPGSTFVSVSAANFFADGKRILFCAQEPGKRTRIYVQDIVDGTPRPITLEGSDMNWGRALSPDDKVALVRAPDGRRVFQPVDGGPAVPVPFLPDSEEPFQWSRDGRSIYIQTDGDFPAEVYRIELATGKRELAGQFTPKDPAGIQASSIFGTPDGKAWIYQFWRGLSELYLAEGLK